MKQKRYVAMLLFGCITLYSFGWNVTAVAVENVTKPIAESSEKNEKESLSMDSSIRQDAEDKLADQKQEVQESAIPDAAFFGGAIPSAWAQEDIRKAMELNLVPSALQAQWKRTITRNEFAEVLTALLCDRGLTNTISNTKQPFLDTQNQNVQWLYDMGVLTGTTATTFSPQQPLAREAAATMAYRLVNTDAFRAPYPDQYAQYEYKDQENLSEWAKKGASFCYRTGVLSGVGENVFLPKTDLTVEQAVIMALRLRNYDISMQPAPITFKPWGIPMLYSNDPEELLNKRFEGAGIYLTQTDLVDEQTMDVEYYHTNYMGSYQNMILGIVATNNSRYEATIDVDKNAYGIGKDAINASKQCYQRFMHGYGSGQGKQTLAGGETRMIVMNVVPGGYLINGRVQLTPHGEDLSIRLVAVKKQLPVEAYANLPRGMDDQHNRTTGLFQYSERTTQIDAAKVKDFTLCGNTQELRALNPGEFPQTMNDPLAVSGNGTAHRAFYLNGNFATTYHLNLTNAAGKKIYIRPNDSRVRDVEAHYFVYSATEGWRDVSATYDNPAVIETLQSANEVCIRFILLGGNYGNVGFHISE